MDVKALQLGKVITKPLDELIEEHRNLSDEASWYICTLGDELLKLQADKAIKSND